MSDAANHGTAAQGAAPGAAAHGTTTRRMTTAQGIKLMLGAQILIGAALLGGDLMRTGSIFGPPAAPTMDQPVRPGDQTRRYNPGQPRTPYTGPAGTPMPTRLQFTDDGGTLRLLGRIAPGDAARFNSHLEDLPEPPVALALSSPGGSVEDALAIGRQVREAGMTVAVGAGDICLSACPYILAAGVERAAHTDATVGVHQHYFGENTLLPAFLAVENIQRGQGEVMDYLDGMGVDVRLMGPALLTPSDEIYVLMPEEMVRYALVTP